MESQEEFWPTQTLPFVEAQYAITNHHQTQRFSTRRNLACGWSLKNSSITTGCHPMCSPSLSVCSPRSWLCCSLVCNRDQWRIWLLPETTEKTFKGVIRLSYSRSDGHYGLITLHGFSRRSDGMMGWASTHEIGCVSIASVHSSNHSQ